MYGLRDQIGSYLDDVGGVRQINLSSWSVRALSVQ